MANSGAEYVWAPETASLPVLAGAEATWQCYVHCLRTWLPSRLEGEGLVRPYIILVVSVGNGRFLTSTSEQATAYGATNILRQKEPPTSQQVLTFLEAVMRAPRNMNSSMADDVQPGRPTAIKLADTPTATLHLGEKDRWAEAEECRYVRGCKGALKALGVEASFAPVPPPLLQEIVRDQIEAQFSLPEGASGLALMPGLNQMEGFTPAFGMSVFQTATDFLASDPWARWPAAARRPVKVSYVLAEDKANEKRFRAQGWAVLLGDPHAEEGDGLGLALYKKEDLAWMAAQGSNLEVLGAAATGQSLLYMPQQEVPLEDLDLITQYGWPVPEDTAKWPLFCKFEATAEGEGAEEPDTMTMTRPGLLDLMWFDLAMKAMMQLLESGDLPGADAADLSVALGPWTVKATTLAAKGEPEERDIDVEGPVQAAHFEPI